LTAGVGGNIAAGTADRGIQVRLMGDRNGEKKPQFLCQFLRLPSWRGIPSSINAQIFRAQVHDASTVEATNGVTVAAAQTRSEVNRSLPKALQCVGIDRGVDNRSAEMSSDRYLTAHWKSLTTAQCPQYIFLCLQKSSDMFVLGGAQSDDQFGKQISDWDYTAGAPGSTGTAVGLDGRTSGLHNYFLSRNSDSAATVAQLEMSIQSSIGAYTYSSEKWPFIPGLAITRAYCSGPTHFFGV